MRVNLLIHPYFHIHLVTEPGSDVLPPEVVLEDPDWVRSRDVLIVPDSRDVIKHKLVTEPGDKGETGGEDQEGQVHYGIAEQVPNFFVRHFHSLVRFIFLLKIHILHKSSHLQIFFASEREIYDHKMKQISLI